jgi:hypothetical protein
VDTQDHAPLDVEVHRSSIHREQDNWERSTQTTQVGLDTGVQAATHSHRPDESAAVLRKRIEPQIDVGVLGNPVEADLAQVELQGPEILLVDRLAVATDYC